MAKKKKIVVKLMNIHVKISLNTPLALTMSFWHLEPACGVTMYSKSPTTRHHLNLVPSMLPYFMVLVPNGWLISINPGWQPAQLGSAHNDRLEESNLIFFCLSLRFECFVKTLRSQIYNLTINTQLFPQNNRIEQQYLLYYMIFGKSQED